MNTLTSEQQQRLVAFEQKLVLHPQLKAVLEETLALILNPSGPPMGAIIGPTGAGKTTLLHQIEKALINTYAERLRTDPGFLPFLTVEARSPERGSFEWKRFFEDVLEAAQEIQVRFKQISFPDPSTEDRRQAEWQHDGFTRRGRANAETPRNASFADR